MPCLAFHDYTAKTTLWHDLGPLQFKALFGKPDYSHIVRDTTAISASQPLKWPLNGPFGAAHRPHPSGREKAAKAAKIAPADYCGFGVGFSGLCPPFPCRAAVGAGV